MQCAQGVANFQLLERGEWMLRALSTSSRVRIENGLVAEIVTKALESKKVLLLTKRCANR